MVLTGLLLTLLAAPPPAPDPLAAANQAFAAGDWEHAARLYRVVVQAHPDQASSWARLGRSLREAGQAREALPALQRAEQLGFAPPLMQYQRALAHAHLGEKDAALALLRPLVAEGFGPPP
ncbi:MAG TPA: tetratricopeptide repeat protein, partial [Myxococcaceae bacterium]|nr:tetratricopeptide repeat protein [Myxococcaceae bacterium]